MTRALRLAGAALAALPPLLAGVASAQELAGRPFPRSAFAPSPYGGGAKSSPSRAPAPCVGPCGDPSGYGAPEPTFAYPAPEPEGYGAPHSVHVGVGAAATQMLNLPRGKSAVVDLPTEARDVMVTDPKVADVVLSTPRRIYVTGVAAGQTDATFVDGMGRRILHLDIRVDQDWTAASDTLATMMPGTKIRVHAANSNLILTGDASSAGEADRALKLVGSFVDRPERIVNLITLTGADQVMLKVRIAEVDRTVIKQLGFDVGALIGAAGGPQYSLAKDITFGVAGALLGGLTGGYNLNTTTQPGAATVGTSVTTLTNGSSTNVASMLSAAGGSAATGTANYGYNTALLVNPATGLPISINGVPQTVTLNGAGQLVNTATLNGSLTGSQTGSLANGTTTTITNNGLNSKSQQLLTGRVGSSGVNQATAMIQAFERVGLVRTLAEPNLTAISGESGRFLVGGEFPVPVSRDVTGSISVEFKPYGVGLGYTPVVLSDGRISLKISTEVSELTSVGGFNLVNGSSGAGSSTPSLSIPGLSVRRAETTVELPSGGSMMIAGLLQAQTKQTLDSLPGLMQIPVLGALLRSRDFQNNETELVIIVTPYLVKPGRPADFATPADGLKIADDVSTNLLGRLNTGFGKSAAATAGKTYQGPYGHVVD